MVVSQGDKLLVGLHVTEYWMLIGRGRGVGYNRETKGLWLRCMRKILGSRSLPDDFFPERKLLDEKYAIRLLPYRNVLDAKSQRYERS